MQFTSPIIMLHLKLHKVKIFNPPTEKNRAKRRGLGEGIFALLQLELECFLFSLIKRNSKQNFFQILSKEKMY